MKIKYITNVRIPTPRAQGYAIMKMCEEFASLGHDVELIVPNRRNNESEKNPYKYYGIKEIFPINKVASLDLLGPFEAFGKIFYWLDIFSFLIYLFFNKRLVEGRGIIFTRDYLVSLVFPNNFICLEIHDVSRNFLFKTAIKKVRLIFVLNKHIKNELIDLGVKAEKIFIIPSGVDISKFDITVTKDEARERLGLPINSKTVVYTGHFYEWKGVDVLAKTAEMLPGIDFVFVGGVEPELSNFRKKYGHNKNIIIKPFEERESMPYYLKSADVLVLPNSSSEAISSKYTSPLKLLEYMASGRPIVASGLPSIREVLTENDCIFAMPDDSKSFATAINKLMSDLDLSNRLSLSARKDVSKFSWENRVLNILSIVKDNEK